MNDRQTAAHGVFTCRKRHGASAETSFIQVIPCSWRILSRCLLAVCVFPVAASCQTRLEQLEATYQTNLRALHAPLLQDYIHQLELLKSQFIARNRLTDAEQVDAEIAKLRAIASTTGVLPYTQEQAAGASPNAEVPASPAPLAPSSGKPDRSGLPTLLAAEAFDGAQVNAKTGALPLGSAAWRIPKLPAGSYNVLMVFSTAALPLPEQIKLNLGGRDFPAVIPADRATGSPETFRLLRLCQITLDSEVTGATLTLTASSGAEARVWMKKLIFVAADAPAVSASK